jgi:glycosyltransferase involved in cell wall biosynthesis
MTSNPLVSVIIPAYNAARFIRGAVESVFDQGYSPLELIVVDDGSTDGTADVLAPYHSRLRYVAQANQGIGGARNRGIQEAQGDLIAFLDADDQWLPGKLDQQVRCLQAQPHVGLVHTDILYWDDATGVCCRRERSRHEYVGRCYTRLFWRNAVNSSTPLIRRACIDQVGGFSSDVLYMEDWDFYLRLARHFQFAYVNEPLARYRLHDHNVSKREVLMRKGDLQVIQKALREDPTLWGTIGRDLVMQRLHELWLAVGYELFRQGEFDEARGYLRQALEARPTAGHAWQLWLATVLPPGMVRPLQSVKRQWTPPIESFLVSE